MEITDKGTLSDFLGVHIHKNDDGLVKMSQPNLEKQILSDLRMDKEEVRGAQTPATMTILRRH